MGSMVSSPLAIAGTIVPIVFGVVKSGLAWRQASALEKLKDKAPHILKPTKTPQQLDHESYTRKREIIIIFIIINILITIAILTAAAPQYMTWTFFFDTEENTELYDILREAGLVMFGIAALVVYGYHVGYLARVSYVSQYWNVPHDIDMSPTGSSFLYAQRDEELDLQSLRAGVFWLVRDPETFAHRLFFIGLVLSSCSWLLLLIFAILTMLCEYVVVQRDMLWAQLYGPIYDTYRAARGGQFWCTCLNAPEARLENLMRKKQQELAEITTVTYGDNTDNNINSNTTATSRSGVSINHK